MHSTILILASLAPFNLAMPAIPGNKILPFIEAPKLQPRDALEHKRHFGGPFPHKSNGTEDASAEEHGMMKFSDAGKEHHHHYNGTGSHEANDGAKEFLKGEYKDKHNGTEHDLPTKVGPTAGAPGKSSSTGYPTTQARDLIDASVADLEPREEHKQHHHHNHHNGTEGVGAEAEKSKSSGEQHYHYNGTSSGAENVPVGNDKSKIYTESAGGEHEHKPKPNATETTESNLPSSSGIHGAPPDISARAIPSEIAGDSYNGTEGVGAGDKKEFLTDYEPKHKHKYNGTATVTPEVASKAKSYFESKGKETGHKHNATESAA